MEIETKFNIGDKVVVKWDVRNGVVTHSRTIYGIFIEDGVQYLLTNPECYQEDWEFRRENDLVSAEKAITLSVKIDQLMNEE